MSASPCPRENSSSNVALEDAETSDVIASLDFDHQQQLELDQKAARIAQAARAAGFGVVCESLPTRDAVAAALKSIR